MHADGTEGSSLPRNVSDERASSERDALLQGMMSAPGVLVSVVEIPLLLQTTLRDLRAASIAALDVRSVTESDGSADDDLDYHFVFTSPATAALFNRDPDAMRGSSARSVGVSAAARANLIRLASLAHQSGRATAGDHLVRQPDGSARWFSLQLIPLDVGEARDASARRDASLSTPPIRPPRFAVVATDIEARVQLERQLQQSQKMEAIGRLAGGVAHDFNNMLTAITGFTRFALDATPAGSPAAQDLREVLAAADRAAALTRGLLAFSRQQVLQMMPLDLNSVIEKLAPMLRRLIGEDVSLELALASEPVRVMADAAQIDQVIMNLVVNARDAMPNGGRVLIETSVTDLLPGELDAEVSAEQVGPRSAVMAISDTGSGMSAETRAKIFDPFFTTKAVGTGTGLGLSTVFGIVQQSGGRITVYSELGFGATFKVYLPFLAAPNEKMATTAAAPRASGTQRATGEILLVEDDAPVRSLARRALTSAGYNVLEAKNGREGHALARNARETLACIVTDLVMPDLGGRDMISLLEGDGIDIPVVVISGYTAQTLTRQSLIRHDAFFLEKPFKIDDLLERVEQAILRGDRRGEASE